MIVLLLMIIAAAVALFWRIQVYFADPRRQELNEKWFARFEQFIRSRYRDRELHWRTYVLEAQFRDK